jgi:hypothetical protein
LIVNKAAMKMKNSIIKSFMQRLSKAIENWE